MSSSNPLGMAAKSFTHVDPFEDTERAPLTLCNPIPGQVSPTSIRSRILKEGHWQCP